MLSDGVAQKTLFETPQQSSAVQNHGASASSVIMSG
jgi:hypothetical protein